MNEHREIIFRTERLFASRWEPGDAVHALEIYGDPEVTRYIGGKPEADIDSMRVRLEALIERNERLGPQMGSFPVFDRATGQLLGSALIKPLPDTSGELTDDIEIGWHLRRSAWRQGYASEFGRKLLSIGFDDLNLPVLHAVVDRQNPASARVAERLGMRFLGLTCRYYTGEQILHFAMDAGRYRQPTESPGVAG